MKPSKTPKTGKPKEEKKKSSGETNALESYLRSEDARRRLIRWLLPALAGSLALNTILVVIALVMLASPAPERWWMLPPYKADAEPMIPLRGDPFTYERVSMWANDVANRLFDFPHSGIAPHFQKMNIYFTEDGFAQFRTDLGASNWIRDLTERNGVLYADVLDLIKVRKAYENNRYWEVSGRMAIRMESPGYKAATDEKEITMLIVRGDPATPVIDPSDPFPPTNFLGLRIASVKLR